jgi:hypothetical protein
MGATSGQSWGETPRASGWGSETSWRSGAAHSGRP